MQHYNECTLSTHNHVAKLSHTLYPSLMVEELSNSLYALCLSQLPTYSSTCLGVSGHAAVFEGGKTVLIVVLFTNFDGTGVLCFNDSLPLTLLCHLNLSILVLTFFGGCHILLLEMFFFLNQNLLEIHSLFVHELIKIRKLLPLLCQ